MIYPFKPSLVMETYTPMIHFPDFFSKGECSNIKAAMRKRTTEKAKVEGDGSGKQDQLVRSTTICGLDPEKDTAWIFEKLAGAIIKGNFDVWGFDLAGFSEVIQISRYEVGDFYGWHMDIGGGVLSQRKLSVVAQLTDPLEYDGGELEFFRNGYAPKELGTLILFPSYLHHQVLPITRGVRHSLVAWLSGTPYK